MNERFLIFVLIWTCSALAAQDTEQLEEMEQLRRLTQSRESFDYQMGPGDLIEISVFGVDNFDREYRVSASGNITVPFLGKIRVERKTGEEIESELTRLITARELIRDPQVSVFVKEFRSQPVFILGAVNQPGQYMTTRQLTILDVIAMAGGVKVQVAEDFAFVQGEQVPQPSEDQDLSSSQKSVLKVDLKGLLEEGDLTQNVSIRGGDVVHIPERRVEIFYVVGEVGKAGAYELPRFEGREFLGTEALAWAGGPGKTANTGKASLIRYDEDGHQMTLTVNFDKIFKGKEPDFAVQPRDVIFIPGSTIKTIGYGLINIIPGTVQWAIVWSAWRR